MELYNQHGNKCANPYKAMYAHEILGRFATAVEAAVCYARRVATGDGHGDGTSVDYASDDDDELPCGTCGSREQGAVMLLCDWPGCTTACHIFCLNPPLTAVPAGDWYCPDCIRSRYNAYRNSSQYIHDAESQCAVVVA